MRSFLYISLSFETIDPLLYFSCSQCRDRVCTHITPSVAVAVVVRMVHGQVWGVWLVIGGGRKQGVPPTQAFVPFLFWWTRPPVTSSVVFSV